MADPTDFRILLTGGGSGGHVYPLLAVADMIRRKAGDKGVTPEIFYYGPADQWSDALSRDNINVSYIISTKLRRYFSLMNIFTLPLLFASIIQVLWKMLWLMPDVIFSKGGPGALPVVLVGWFYRVPIFVHESDAIPGVTNIISGRFAEAVGVSFEKALKYFSPSKGTWTGNPVREDLLEDRMEQKKAKKALEFDPNEPLMLVWGGSQGSKRINDFLLTNLSDVLKTAQVLHQTGTDNFLEVKQLSRAVLVDVPLATEMKSRYQPVPYLDENLKIALTAADIVVCRAGSGTIFEIAAFGKPSVIIPLEESANDHQRANAYEFAKTGSAIVIEEENLLPGIFLNQLKDVFKDPEMLATMSKASAEFYKPEAASMIADAILNIALRIS